MDIKERVVEGVSVLDISGKIVLGEGDIQVKDRIKDLLADGQRSILLNLGDVSYMDSAGLGALISAYTTVKREGGQLKLVNSPSASKTCSRLRSSSRSLILTRTRMTRSVLTSPPSGGLRTRS